MYEYISTAEKKKEFWIVAILSLTATFLFIFSKQSFCAYPAIWQLMSVFLLVVVIMLVSNCLLRRFIYRVSPREGAGEDEPWDLTIVECRSKRRRTVCRISVAEIVEITPITRENRKRVSKETKASMIYRYYAELSPQNLYRLTVQNEVTVFDLFIVADERLIEMLKKG